MYWSLCVGLLCMIAVVHGRGKPPAISVPQGNVWNEKIQYVRKGTKMSFICEAIGSPPPTYKWIVNGTDINSKAVSFDSNTGVLSVTIFFSLLDVGEYQCIATNDYGTAMTTFLTLRATEIHPFEGQTNPEPVVTVAYETDYVMLKCNGAPYSSPPAIFSWEILDLSNNNEVIKGTQVQTNERVVIDKSGNLHILWVEQNDGNKVYACAARNDVLEQSSRNTEKFKLEVRRKSAVDRAPLLKYNQDVSVPAGETAVLTCIFSHYSREGRTLNLVWIHNGEEVGRGNTITVDTKLQEGANAHERMLAKEGEYMIEAYYGNSKPPQATAKINLKIVEPPQFIANRSIVSQSVPVEKKAVFDCAAKSRHAYADPAVWLLNGQPLLGCPPNFFECKAPLPTGFSQCIPPKSRCNKYSDCEDGSDEDFCGVSSCPEAQKKCHGECINDNEECVHVACDYPDFLCGDKITCITDKAICDGMLDCPDGSDESTCPGKQDIIRKRFQISSDRTQLTLPGLRLDDTMCFQCMITNKFGTSLSDGCLTVIDKIVVKIAPNSTYDVEPGTNLSIVVDATTDVLWQNHMRFKWYWYEEVGESDQGGKRPTSKFDRRKRAPPAQVAKEIPFEISNPKLRRYFRVNADGKNLTILFPEVKVDDRESYDLYYAMKDRLYTLVIAHRYDGVSFNFTINGVEVVKPKPDPVVEAASTNLWFIALILAILILFIVVALIVCYMYRNRGGTYPLDKKEHQAGHDPAQELKDNGFHDVGRVDDDYDDKPHGEEASLSESVKPYESDDDPTEEYGGDFDVSKFNEDGSFIGLYGDKKSKYSSEAKEATV
ncbi:Contactin 3a [Mactra antiquata]